jgi:SAM-dependent methyltransferase
LENLDRVYAQRFVDPDFRTKDRVWAEVGRYLQRYVDRTSPAMDIGCDRGYFTRNVVATDKWACDVRDMSASLPAGTHFIRSSGLNLPEAVPRRHFGTVFMSNYLEHLRSSDQVIQQLRIAFDLLRDGGRVVVLQPNIRLTGPAYWDFIDHHVPITDRSLVEASEAAGFATERVIVRFLPYTTKGRLPAHPWLVRLYLHCGPAKWLLGGQTLYVGRRP